MKLILVKEEQKKKEQETKPVEIKAKKPVSD